MQRPQGPSTFDKSTYTIHASPSSFRVLTRPRLRCSEVRIPLLCVGFETLPNPSHLSFHILVEAIHRSLIFLLVRLPPGRIGALTGAGVGLTIGFIFGSYSILR